MASDDNSAEKLKSDERAPNQGRSAPDPAEGASDIPPPGENSPHKT